MARTIPKPTRCFWGTSNPWPDLNDDYRAGDNLYSCSVLALDPDTGKLQWYYQFTPHDLHDWDSTQIPILLDTEFRGKMRKTLAWANRNGFYYLLDRTNGKFLTAKAFVKQTWNNGFDDNGRPEVIPGNEPTPEGNDHIWPGVDGGANWMSHSYSPLTKWLYVFAREEHRLFSKNAVPHPTTEEPDRPLPPGALPNAGAYDPAAGGAKTQNFGAPEESWGKVIAVEPSTGNIKWEYRVLTPPWGGRDGNRREPGLRRDRSEGVIFALNATTGDRLWTFAANGPVFASPISYLANGKQMVSIPAGDLIVTFGLD